MSKRAVGIRRAQHVAQTLIGRHHVDAPPVPVERIVAAEGLKVVYETLQKETSAVLVRQPDGTRVIGVNALHAPTRQRFSLAHELGHAVLHFDPQAPEQSEAVVDRPLQVLFRDGLASAGTNRVEIDANAFAAELLMPAKMTEEAFGHALIRHPRDTDRAIRELARDFNVSPQAMTYRLVNLHLIDPS